MRRAVSILSILFVMCLYQNMDLVSADFASLHRVDEKARSTHARELLGSEYFNSSAEYADDIAPLNQQIYKEFRKKLPKAYRHRAKEYTNILLEEALKANIDPVLALAVIAVESSFNPRAKGTSGEMGLMQLMPNTAVWIAKKTGHSYRGGEALYSPSVNIVLGVRYIAFLRKSFRGEGFKYIAAYNMGAANVRKLVAQNTKPKIYPSKVMKNYKKLYVSLTTQPDKAVKSSGWQVAGH